MLLRPFSCSLPKPKSMEQTLQALGGILLKSIPTIVFLLFLVFFLKGMLFGPLERLLRERDELTAGARKAAEEAIKRAEKKAADFDAALREARLEAYREQEELRRKWLAEQAAQIADARAAAATLVDEARRQIAAESEAAREALRAESHRLAEEIAAALLAGRVR
jgi:F-type H+-transporting ATPase subunit b